MTTKPRVFLGLPHYGQVYCEVAKVFYLAASKTADVQHADASGSLLASVFNGLWAAAVVGGHDWFAMLHADVVPEPWWIDKLLDIAEGTEADVVSAIVPIKDGRGLTSTAIDHDDEPWRQRQRLTMAEIHNLPETFSAASFPGALGLLVNTGCFLVRLGPWAKGVRFSIRDRILWTPDGPLVQTIPEDWDFSRQARAAGKKIVATRAVQVRHLGSAHYGNAQPWGLWRTDQATEFAAGPARQRT